MTGKDPNIANELGHTYYPKWVKNKEGKDIIVQNAEEEKDATGKKPDKQAGWGDPKANTAKEAE